MTDFATSRKAILEAIYSIFQQSGSRGYFIESGLNFARPGSSSQEYPYEINLSTSAFKSSYILRIDNIPTYQPSFLTHNIYIFSPSFKKEIYTNDDCLLILLVKK